MAFRVYKASAGSGKTFTLVKEYLLLALKNPEKYRRILAVTFTNKAANEMKQRIVEALAQLANTTLADSSEDPLLQLLINESGMDESLIRMRATNVLSSVVHNYSDFAISTIDSFVYKLVRTFAHDLRLPHQFEVELNDQEVVGLAVDMLIDKVGSDEFITNTLIGFLLQRMSEEGSWLIEHEIARFCNYLLREDGFDQIIKLEEVDANVLTNATNFLYQSINQYENEIVPIANEALLLINKQDIQPVHLASGKAGVYSFFEKMAKGKIDEAKANSSAAKILQGAKWSSAKGENDRVILSRLKSIEPKLNEYLYTIMQVVDTGFERYMLRKELVKDMHSLAVMSELQHNMEEIRNEENSVHISEFNKRIAKLLSNVAVPYIYERLGERFQHYLIDEFQDTSVLQWHNFIPLVDNALASENLTLVVGDAKQSIYRFRSGEVEQFMQLPTVYHKERNPLIADAEVNLKAQYDYQNLAFNFRSDEMIVEFNNDFFDFLRDRLPETMQIAYDDHRQKVIKPKHSGFVQLQFIEKQGDKLETVQVYLEQCLQLVRQQLDAGFKPCDIAILAQKNEEGSQIARYLTGHGIEVVSVEGLLVDSSAKVSILVNLLNLIQHAYEPVAITTILHNLKVLSPDHDFDWQIHLQDIMAQSPADRFATFKEILFQFGYDFAPASFHALSLYDMVERLVRQFGFHNVPDPYVQFFLEFVHEYQVKRQGSLADFLIHWSESKDKLSVIVPNSTNAIQVMTIHKAKGLEFPVVIFPFANKSVRNAKKEFWVDLQPDEVPGLPVGIVKVSKRLNQTRLASMYADENDKSFLDWANLLYVVLTRASKRLFIVSELPGTKPAKNYQTFFKNFLEYKSLWADDLFVYSFGNKENALPKSMPVKQEIQAPIPVYVSSDWSHKLCIAPDPIGQWMLSEEGKAMHWGQLVHGILSEIRYDSDAPRVLNKYFQDGTITRLQHDELSLLFDRMFTHQSLSQCFRSGSRLYLERELMTPDGKVYRPDRCVSLPTHNILIDYKTGRPDPSHTDQMKMYKEILLKLENKSVESYLVYLHRDLEVVKC
jgi:ATP-dependent exoDNAse (exonuclease V) beta subunit